MIKIIMQSHRIRKQELTDKAVKSILQSFGEDYGDPNAPSLTNGYDVYVRRNCPQCGTRYWAAQHQGVCNECMSLALMEIELNQQMFRKERELRLRELEDRLAET